METILNVVCRMEGEWKNGLLNGNYILNVVCRMEGEWKNGLLNGEIKANIINTGWIEGYYKQEYKLNNFKITLTINIIFCFRILLF